MDGKDDVYDGIMTEIRELEQELDEQLKKFEKSLGYISRHVIFPIAVADSSSKVFAHLLAQRNRQ